MFNIIRNLKRRKHFIKIQGVNVYIISFKVYFRNDINRRVIHLRLLINDIIYTYDIELNEYYNKLFLYNGIKIDKTKAMYISINKILLKKLEHINTLTKNKTLSKDILIE